MCACIVDQAGPVLFHPNLPIDHQHLIEVIGL
jgi:hypothetical protein